MTELERFHNCHPQPYRRIATKELVWAIKSVVHWEFEDFQVGDWIIYDQARTYGDKLYRCPPKRFSILYEQCRGVG